jgi:hypothetical protein
MSAEVLSSRGGARRQKVADMSQPAVHELFQEHVKKHGVTQGLYFHEYELMDRSHAAGARGLGNNFTVLEQVLKLCPAAELKATMLTNVFTLLAKQYRGLNATSLPDDLWAGRRGDILSTMLCHLRRIKGDLVRYKQLKHKATDSDMDKVNVLLSLVRMSGHRDEETQSEAATMAPTVLYSSRRLVRQVSVDSDGYPILLSEGANDSVSATRASNGHSSGSKSMDRSSLAASLAAAGNDDFLAELMAMSVTANAGTRLAASADEVAEATPSKGSEAKSVRTPAAKRFGFFGPDETPAPKSRKTAAEATSLSPTSKPAAAKKVSAPAASLPEGNRFECAAFGVVRLTKATAQSYITVQAVGAEKKSLLIGIGEKQSVQHQALIIFIWRDVCSGAITDKAGAIARRASLLQ